MSRQAVRTINFIIFTVTRQQAPWNHVRFVHRLDLGLDGDHRGFVQREHDDLCSSLETTRMGGSLIRALTATNRQDASLGRDFDHVGIQATRHHLAPISRSGAVGIIRPVCSAIAIVIEAVGTNRKLWWIRLAGVEWPSAARILEIDLLILVVVGVVITDSHRALDNDRSGRG